MLATQPLRVEDESMPLRSPSLLRARKEFGPQRLAGIRATQLDFTLRRAFSFTERWKLQVSADFFNIFNHPNFANPDNTLTDPLFGRSLSMLNQSLGSGGAIGGFNPLYQIGGPRSVQLALKLSF